MNIGETLYVTDREAWRLWLSDHHKTASEIWLVYFNKKSGKPKIPYDEAVEEALCFGWIDSTQKKLDDYSTAQRFCPRRKNSELSELNRMRVRKMVREGRMTPAGLESIGHHLKVEGGIVIEHKPFKIPADILENLKEDKEVWKNFKKLPETYRQIRIAYIEHSRPRPEEYQKRLNYFIKMTRENKMFGSYRE